MPPRIANIARVATRYRLPPIAALVALSLLLAWWQPWRSPATAPPRPVALVPTPTPPRTPTATRAPERIALPVGTPTIPPTPAATPASAASPVPDGPRAPGMLLYIGATGGKQGIIAASADGREHWLVVEGQYKAVAWSPSSDRFAAIGTLDGPNDQLAIFASDGRPLARYPFEGTVTSLLWSPDGSRLAWTVLRRDANPTSATWLLTSSGEPQLVAIPEASQVQPLAWTPSGNLYVTSSDTRRFSSDLWLVTPDGTDASRATGGSFFSLGLADVGQTLFAVSVAAAAPSTGGATQPTITEIVAIDLRSGKQRLLADANALGQQIFGDSAGPLAYHFVNGRSAPDGSALALVIAPQTAPGTPRPNIPRDTTALVIVRSDGTIAGTLRLRDGDRGGPIFWSPDSRLFAFLSLGGATNEYALKIIDTTGAIWNSYPAQSTYPNGGPSVAWSPDSRWLVYTAPAGLTIAPANGTQPYPLNTTGTNPAWRPR